MGWKVVQRRIGRAGGRKQRLAKQRQWNQKYGQDMWVVGYKYQDDFITQEEALETIYYKSYETHFQRHPEDLQELLTLARSLRNPHAEATTGVDLQVPAIMDYLHRHGLTLQGREVLDIGTWKGESSHALSVRLSPLHIKVHHDPRLTLEGFWQSKKCLALWQDEEEHP